MTIKEILKNSQTVLFMRIVHEKLLEVPLLAKYIANGNRMGDKDKLRQRQAVVWRVLTKQTFDKRLR